jgi:hypothetical protein
LTKHDARFRLQRWPAVMTALHCTALHCTAEGPRSHFDCGAVVGLRRSALRRACSPPGHIGLAL